MVFKTTLKEISQDLLPLGESGSEVSHYIPEPRKISEVPKFSDYIKKPWPKGNSKRYQKPN